MWTVEYVSVYVCRNKDAGSVIEQKQKNQI